VQLGKVQGAAALARTSAPVCGVHSRLEGVLQTKLDLAHRDCDRRDHTRGAWSVIDEVVRLRKVRMVQSVEKFRAELKSLSLS
jgi:hypothetical protein